MIAISDTLTVLLVGVLALSPGGPAGAGQDLPSPLRLSDVVRLASERRDEIHAARARTRAGEARPALVSALADPMLSTSLDHLPFGMRGADFNVTLEQQVPLSRVRGHRRASALADVGRLRAAADATALDVRLEAANAFVMLQERRQTAALVAEQVAFARDVVTAANARYASGTAPQSDVLRAEVEVARLDAFARALVNEVRAAEALLNAALGRDADRPVPPLAPVPLAMPPPPWPAVKDALESRPELTAARAEIARAEADVRVMRDMSRPMLTFRTGPASTMAEGAGWMAMAGLSLPVWRGKVRAGIAEAEAMQRTAEADLRATARAIEGDAAAALHQLHAARERRTALHGDVLPRARMAIDPAIAAYASGQLPLVSVIEAVQALWMVQSDLVAADTALGLAWARLGRATGSFEAIVQ